MAKGGGNGPRTEIFLGVTKATPEEVAVTATVRQGNTPVENAEMTFYLDGILQPGVFMTGGEGKTTWSGVPPAGASSVRVKAEANVPGCPPKDIQISIVGATKPKADTRPRVDIEESRIAPGIYRVSLGAFSPTDGKAVPAKLTLVPSGQLQATNQSVRNAPAQMIDGELSIEIPTGKRVVYRLEVPEAEKKVCVDVFVDGWDEKKELVFFGPPYRRPATVPAHATFWEHATAGWQVDKGRSGSGRTVFAFVAIGVFLVSYCAEWFGSAAWWLVLIFPALALVALIPLWIWGGKTAGRIFGFFPGFFLRSNNRWFVAMFFLTIVAFINTCRTPTLVAVSGQSPATQTQKRELDDFYEHAKREAEKKYGLPPSSQNKGEAEKATQELEQANKPTMVRRWTNLLHALVAAILLLLMTAVYGVVALRDEARTARLAVERRLYERAGGTTMGAVVKNGVVAAAGPVAATAVKVGTKGIIRPWMWEFGRMLMSDIIAEFIAEPRTRR